MGLACPPLVACGEHASVHRVMCLDGVAGVANCFPCLRADLPSHQDPNILSPSNLPFSMKTLDVE